METKPDLNDVSEVIGHFSSRMSHFAFIIRALARHQVGGVAAQGIEHRAWSMEKRHNSNFGF